MASPGFWKGEGVSANNLLLFVIDRLASIIVIHKMTQFSVSLAIVHAIGSMVL